MATVFGVDAAAGQCFHLAAGPGRSASVQELAEATCALFGTPQVSIRPPGLLLRQAANWLRPLAMRAMPSTTAILDIMYDYGAGMPQFDTRNLMQLGFAAPRVIDYPRRRLTAPAA
jgi:hypothetical protein